jgi:hypothetical protein
MTGITGNLREDTDIFMKIFRLIFLRMRNILDKIYLKNQNSFDIQLLIAENRAVYEIWWKNIVQSERPQLAIWCMCITC